MIFPAPIVRVTKIVNDTYHGFQGLVQRATDGRELRCFLKKDCKLVRRFGCQLLKALGSRLPLRRLRRVNNALRCHCQGLKLLSTGSPLLP
jgi:hypothetical protein